MSLRAYLEKWTGTTGGGPPRVSGSEIVDSRQRHAQALAGGEALLNQSGDIGQALFSAAVGTASLRDILFDLQNSAEALFTVKGSKKPVNRAITGFKDARKKASEKQRWIQSNQLNFGSATASSPPMVPAPIADQYTT